MICDVIVVFAVPRARSGIEEIVTSSDELEDLNIHSQKPSDSKTKQKRTHDTSHTPNIRAGSPFRAEYDFGATVLPCLDIVHEMVFCPSG
jgi:hypothetical protein